MTVSGVSCDRIKSMSYTQTSRRNVLIIGILLPLFAVVIVDQYTKHLALTLTESYQFGFLHISLLHNHGFMMGSLATLSKLYTLVLPATYTALLLFVFGVFQYFLPIESLSFRAGLSIIMGGVIGNIIDRVSEGSVVDFLYIKTSHFTTGVFNIADALQWLGALVFLISYAANGRILYPVNQRRGRMWIDPKFQRRYCTALIASGAGFAVVAGMMATTFLKFAAEESLMTTPESTQLLILSFLRVYTATTCVFFIILFLVGVYLSHRIAGPIKGFENYLDQLVRGSQATFSLRKGDDFQQLERLANIFYQQFHEPLGIDPDGLVEGGIAPAFEAETLSGKHVDTSQFLGKKVWIIFYRYVTCPICAYHVDSIKEIIQKAVAAGVQVLAVYESEPSEMLTTDVAATIPLLNSLSIPLISDPDRHIYRAYRTRADSWAIAYPSTWMSLIKARLKNYRQGTVYGNIGQLPAQFLINEKGVIYKAYYGAYFSDHIDPAEILAFIGSD